MPASFFTLPLELRELIYEEVFSSITIRHGFRTSSSNRTALLQVCKQVHREGWRHLPLNVQFHFRGTETMLETLLSVDQAVVTRIRHIRVKSFPFPLYNSGRYVFLAPHTVFALLFEWLVTAREELSVDLGSGRITIQRTTFPTPCHCSPAYILSNLPLRIVSTDSDSSIPGEML